MKRFLLVAVNVALVGTLAWADLADAPPDPGEQARHLHRNRGLVKALVDGSLQLAGEQDPLRRADACNEVVAQFADALGQAADDRDGDRAAELGLHLRDLLEQGVAGNLTVASKNFPLDSPTGNQELLKVGKRVAEVSDPLELRLRRAAEAQPEFQRALRSVLDGRVGVENILKKRGLKLK